MQRSFSTSALPFVNRQPLSLLPPVNENATEDVDELQSPQTPGTALSRSVSLLALSTSKDKKRAKATTDVEEAPTTQSRDSDGVVEANAKKTRRARVKMTDAVGVDENIQPQIIPSLISANTASKKTSTPFFNAQAVKAGCVTDQEYIVRYVEEGKYMRANSGKGVDLALFPLLTFCIIYSHYIQQSGK
jgi:hypothetical protein